MTTTINKTELETTIHGYKVYLNLDGDGDGSGTTFCHITKGRHCASLELIDSFGGFDDGEEGEMVPQRTIDAIRAWAEKHGY